MSERRVVITGRGVCSPIGCDWPSFASGVVRGIPAPLGQFPDSTDVPLPCRLLSDADVLARSPVQEGEPLGRLAAVAIRDALLEAGLPLEGEEPLDDVGLVMNNVLGPSTAIEAYLERLREKGPRASRPAQFVDTLLSMPASRAGIALRLRGSTAVLGGSSALELAFDWVRHGREQTVVAGGAEHLSPKCIHHLDRLAAGSGAERQPLAQAAAFVVLEDAAHAGARGVPALAGLLGSGGASEAQDVALPWSRDPEGRALAVSMAEALADAGLQPGDVRAAMLASGDDASEAAETEALRTVFGDCASLLTLLRPKRLAGEALGGSGGVALLAAIAYGVSPVLVNAFEMGGSAGSLVVTLP
jgi:3-oxoacyl-[acyl-carrier-protein] synthase II